MWRTEDGSTGRLAQLCAGYFVFYLLTGLQVKYFLGKQSLGLPEMNEVEFLVYSTGGSMLLCVGAVLALGWYRLETVRPMRIGPLSVPSELLYIVPSGVCTAVVIPTTTLMYSLPISVMVAMVIMRGSVIVISRAVDAIQIAQGILKRRVYWQENVAVGFALGAVGVHIFGDGGGKFDFLSDVAAMTILSSYLAAYSLRIYIMNYFKNTEDKGVKRDNRAFFGVEQLAASATLAIVGAVLVALPGALGEVPPQLTDFSRAFRSPDSTWAIVALSGTAFGIVAFFSVAIFMFKGRTATFAGLVNRLTSLIAGTASTLVFAAIFGGRWPKADDWISFGFILVAVGFLTVAERRRTAENARIA